MKRILNRATKAKLITDNPAADIKAPKVPRRQPRFLTLDERQRFLRIAEETNEILYLVVVLGTYLGLRKAEILALTWQDINLNTKVVQVANSEFFTTKNGRNRSVPISDELVAILLRFRTPTGFVVRPDHDYKTDKPVEKRPRYRWDFRGVFEKAVTTAGLDPKIISPHVLRHTFASTLAQKGVSLFKIGEWMGHSMSEVTSLYAHLLPYDSDINRLDATKIVEPKRGGVAAG
jgi:integrase